MLAAIVPRYGPPDIVRLEQRALPEPAAGQVRIRVQATSVTAGDWRLRSGDLPRGFGLLRGPMLGFGGPRQPVLGTDAVGRIDAVGSGVSAFAVGDDVIAFPGGSMGAHAQALCMAASGCLVRRPPQLSLEAAAALPFGGVTAIDFLRRAHLQPGERVLVNGASGQVGSAMVQLARETGAHVTGVCSAANVDLVLSLGAAVVIDHQRADFVQAGQRWDVVVDTVGNAPYARVQPVLNRGGRLLAIVADLPNMLLSAVHGRRHGHRVIAGPAAERQSDLAQLVQLAAAGRFVPVIDRVLPFEQIADAHRLADSGRKRGAVVLRLPDAATGA